MSQSQQTRHSEAAQYDSRCREKERRIKNTRRPFMLWKVIVEYSNAVKNIFTKYAKSPTHVFAHQGKSLIKNQFEK